MFAIVTSMRAKALASSWEYHVWLLDRVLNSMLAQETEGFRVYVVCHERPESEFGDNRRVRFVTAHNDVPARDNDEMCADKVLKLSVGAQLAVAEGCEYIVMNDADDLLSRRIGALVEREPGAAGWYSDREYFHSYGDRWVRLQRLPSWSSGPCAVVRADLLGFEPVNEGCELSESLKRTGSERFARALLRAGTPVNRMIALGHTEYPRAMRELGFEMRPMPFAANVVINHPDSTSSVPGGLGSSVRAEGRTGLRRFGPPSIRKFALDLLTVRPLGKRLRAEFGVPEPSAVPRAYRSIGSAFSR